MGGNLELEVEAHRMQKPKKELEIKNSAQLARWPPGTMSMVAEALVKQVERRAPTLKPLSWEEHIQHGHVPFRRDCLICQQSLQQQAPHRRVRHPLGGVLSVDTAGPFIRANDVGGIRTAYILVGVLTWVVPKTSPLKEDEVEEIEGEAPNFEVGGDGSPESVEDQLADPIPNPHGIFDDPEEEDHEVEGAEAPEVEAEERGERAPEGEAEERGEKAPEGEAEKEESEEKKKEEVEWETRVFRLATPMYTKQAKEVVRVVMDMLLRLRADGYHVGHIHSDQGHEFQGHFKTWCRERGIYLTRTPGDDPRANGRAEASVKAIKTQVRRVLLQAEAAATWWPWATRFVNELNRAARLGRKPDWPPFLSTVMIRKRKWRRGTFEISTENVKYLCPSPEDHGHWVLPEGERPRITKLIMKKAQLPVADEGWIALEREAADGLAVRRRLRGKSAVRKIEEYGEVEEESEENKERRVRILRVIEEEMRRMVEDEAELAVEELQILAKLKKHAGIPNEEEEVLQTRIVSPREVSQHWEEWLPAVRSEVESLLREKEAFSEIYPEELERLKKEAEEKGKGIEYIPSKLVFTRKPGPDGGKKKVRWVVCGNLEPRREDEENFSSGADASALRILVWVAARNQWSAVTLDIKTAFLNAKMIQDEEEDLILVKPPFLFTEKRFLRKDVLYKPEKAIYGFRRSPKLWGQTRDETVNGFEIEGEHMGKKMIFVLEALQSEPNLWKLHNAEDADDLTVYGLLMTYVDDLLITAAEPLMLAIQQKIQSTWSTSKPEPVTH